MQPETQLKTALKNGFDPNILYKDPLTIVKEPMCTILEKHSKIPVDKVVSHVNKVVSKSASPFKSASLTSFRQRDRAFAVVSTLYPYALPNLTQ
jgi:hypothetical protein